MGMERAIALFGMKRDLALYDFFTGGGRSHFLYRKGDRPLRLFTAGDRSFWYRAGRSPFTTFSQGRAIALFGIVPVDRPLLLFLREGRSLFWGGRRSLFGMRG
jgi:hypothetical protein